MSRRPARVAAAPITWGVSEVAGWGRQLDPARVLAEMARAGLTATELGPRGFLPDDPAQIQRHLARHGLVPVGAFVSAVLHRDAVRRDELDRVEAIARGLAGAGAGVLVLAAETGTPGYESSPVPDDGEWDALREGVAGVEAIARRHGLVVAFHPHHGTVVAREAEIRRLLATTTVPLCLDPGHLMVAGADPLGVARAARGRIAHVHLKDVDAALAARVRGGGIGYRDAVRRGLFRPLGQGDVDLEALLALLERDGYDGWYVLEQDLVIESEPDDGAPMENTVHSIRFLERLMAA